ncbi:MAG: coenzyme F420-0:L-glutamate ligase / coenzyme F420-1:gamma-L-glutamate ligase [Methanosaeta sp. NSM2]|nr:coenzyme F420-0:L-glutamate ligase [Methanothrix sp.]OYV11899.1 MAG: coenzyme F420-0:L-glutamate ligase / coenzyme F420-1:gamma-L-glutamate ligase [Methanosaeta sp. NSM2]
MQPSLQGYVVEGLPIIKPGDDIAALIESLFNIQDGDILCLASTVVAKSEGRLRTLESYRPSERAERIARQVGKDSRFVQAVLDESADVLLEKPFLLTKTRFGHIGVNAGIDQSNVGGGRILLLPEDPSRSAEKLRRSLNKNCAVIITDTCGRPFRCGVTGVAIGWAGISALQDWRGKRDMHGKVLEITLEAVVDEIASAANLLMGEAGDGTPAIVFRGLRFPSGGKSSVFMPEDRDVIRPFLRR